MPDFAYTFRWNTALEALPDKLAGSLVTVETAVHAGGRFDTASVTAGCVSQRTATHQVCTVQCAAGAWRKSEP